MASSSEGKPVFLKAPVSPSLGPAFSLHGPFFHICLCTTIVMATFTEGVVRFRLRNPKPRTCLGIGVKLTEDTVSASCYLPILDGAWLHSDVVYYWLSCHFCPTCSPLSRRDSTGQKKKKKDWSVFVLESFLPYGFVCIQSADFVRKDLTYCFPAL